MSASLHTNPPEASPITVTGSVTNARLEAGSYLTSYIATAASAVTRQADSATMPVGAWYNAAQSRGAGREVYDRQCAGQIQQSQRCVLHL